ncbi:MAG: helix-turn-helix domain-containing protein [bacterium]
MTDPLAIALADLGLALDEARTYVELNRTGASSATDVARALRVSRPRAYRALEGLVGSGHVTASVGRPRIFAPVPPAIVVKGLQLRALAQVELLEQARRDLVPRIQALGGAAKASQEPSFALVRGRQALAAQAQQLAAGAHGAVDMLLDDEAGKDAVKVLGAASALAERARQGIAVRVLVPAAVQSLQRLPAALRLPNVAVRQWRRETVSTCFLADRKEAVIVVSGRSKGEMADEGWLAIRTTAAHFVATNQAIFDRIWTASPPETAKP